MELFLFKISSISDVITNSSSELFVFDNTTENKKSVTKKAIKELLDSIYPDWKTEYTDPEIVGNYDDENLEWFWSWYKVYEDCESEWIDTYNCSEKKFNELKQIPKLLNECEFASRIGLTPEECYSNWTDWNPCKRMDYRETPWEEIDHYRNLELSKQGLEAFREFCKKSGFIIIVSHDENPDFKKQELILSVASKKYHLG